MHYRRESRQSRQSIPKKQQESQWPFNNFLNCCSKKDDEPSLDREFNMIPQRDSNLQSYNHSFKNINNDQSIMLSNQKGSQNLFATPYQQTPLSPKNLKVSVINQQSDTEKQMQKYYGSQNLTTAQKVKESENLRNVVTSQISFKDNISSRQQYDNNDPFDFWNRNNVAKFLQVKLQHVKYQAGANNYYSQSSEFVKNRYREIQKKMNEMKKKLYQEANQQYMLSKQKMSKQEQLRYDELSEIKEQIDFDLGWQIFDEVNQFNDVTKIIDLNCLDPYIATIIVHQKLLDIAEIAKVEYEAKRRNGLILNNSKVLQIVCGKSLINTFEDFLLRRSQIQDIEDDQNFQSSNKLNKYPQNFNKNKSSPYNIQQNIENKMGDLSVLSGTEHHDRNHIIEYLKQELKLDHYYVKEQLIILVRVDEETYNQIYDQASSRGIIDDDQKSNNTSKNNRYMPEQNQKGQKRQRNISQVFERNERELELKDVNDQNVKKKDNKKNNNTKNYQ